MVLGAIVLYVLICWIVGHVPVITRLDTYCRIIAADYGQKKTQRVG